MTSLATSILKDPQVQIHYIHKGTLSVEQLRYLGWFFVFDRVKFSLSLYSQSHHLKEQLTLLNAFQARFCNIQQNLYELLKGGSPFFQNFYHSIYGLSRAVAASALFEQFKEVPLIVCGAGPSLEKHFEILKTLKNSALIFAGGSAVNALVNHGIHPHFSGHIDPNSTQALRLLSDKGFEVPRFYGHRLNSDALRLIHASSIFVNTTGYRMAEWAEEKLNFIRKESQGIDTGFGVSNWGVSLGYAMGCNPIVLVGMDLAFTEKKLYCKGIIKDNIQKTDSFDGEPLEVTDLYGVPTHSLWKWIMEGQWYGKSQKKQTKTTIINATEGGMPCAGIQNIPLLTVKEKFFVKEWDLNSRVRTLLLNNSSNQCSNKEILFVLENIDQSFSVCIELYKSLSDEVSDVHKKLVIGDEIPKSLHTAREALFRAELIEELAFIHYIEGLEVAYEQYLERKYYKLSRERLTEREKTLKLLEIQVEKYLYIIDLCKEQKELLLSGIQEGEQLNDLPFKLEQGLAFV